MADLSVFKRGQIVAARMVGVSVAKTPELLGVERRSVSKVMTAFRERKKNLLTDCKTLEESESCLIVTVGLSRVTGRITRLHFRKLQHSLMTISSIQFLQKLYKERCTKTDFTRRLQSENHIKRNLFNISVCFHYFV